MVHSVGGKGMTHIRGTITLRPTHKMPNGLGALLSGFVLDIDLEIDSEFESDAEDRTEATLRMEELARRTNQ